MQEWALSASLKVESEGEADSEGPVSQGERFDKIRTSFDNEATKKPVARNQLRMKAKGVKERSKRD